MMKLYHKKYGGIKEMTEIYAWCSLCNEHIESNKTIFTKYGIMNKLDCGHISKTQCVSRADTPQTLETSDATVDVIDELAFGKTNAIFNKSNETYSTIKERNDAFGEMYKKQINILNKEYNIPEERRNP